MADFEEAKDKVMLGAERKSMVMSDEDKKLAAFHEAGHALVAKFLPGAQPIHKATIIPRGQAMGMVAFLPDEDGEPGASITLEVSKTVHQNAQRYFEEAPVQKNKAKGGQARSAQPRRRHSIADGNLSGLSGTRNHQRRHSVGNAAAPTLARAHKPPKPPPKPPPLAAAAACPH